LLLNSPLSVGDGAASQTSIDLPSFSSAGDTTTAATSDTSISLEECLEGENLAKDGAALGQSTPLRIPPTSSSNPSHPTTQHHNRSRSSFSSSFSPSSSSGAAFSPSGSVDRTDSNLIIYPGLDASAETDRLPERLLPTGTSFLRSGSRFTGTQQSGRSKYDVSVELKHVDFRESRVCGYLHIQGLTEDHPSLTTFFEGEIIGPKYSFLTKRPDWGASEKTDLQHWARFASWRPLARQARRADFCFKNFAHKEHIYMRWKECFLVPNHRVSDINGASFAGFYYVCFNQITGDVSGLYFHQSSEKYQQLELSHVSTRGAAGTFEFR